MGTGEVNVARNAPSLEGSCMPPKTEFVLWSRGVLKSPLFPLSSLNSGTGAFAADPRMLYLPGPGRIPGVSGDMKPFGRSGDICPARSGDRELCGMVLVEKNGDS